MPDDNLPYGLQILQRLIVIGRSIIHFQLI